MTDRPTTRLREVRDADLAVLGAIRNDVELQQQLMARPRPNSDDRVREWLERVGSDPATAFFVIADADDRSVGFVQVAAMDLVSGHGRLGIAVAPEARGRGHASAAIAAVGAHVHAVFGLRKIVLEVRSDNVGAIAVYRSLGFREVGTLRAHFRLGEHLHDVVVMEQFLEP